MASGFLACSVKASCGVGEVQVFRMSSTANAHAGTPGSSAYGNVVCCGGVDGLGTNCSGVHGTVLTLSAADNAHVASDGSYSTPVCLSVGVGGAVDCTYGTSCGVDYACLATISGATPVTTNAHVADCGVGGYATKVCCQASPPTPTPEADLKIVDQYVASPPSTIPMSQDVLVTLNKVVHNNGPVEPVDARSEAVVTAPPGCTVSPPTHVQLYSGLPVSMDVVHSEPFLIHCYQPSSHTFAFDNSIEVTTPGVTDPNPGSNTAHTELTVAAVTQTDIKIVGETFTVRPPKPLPLNTDVDVTLRKTIHNNGPYGPVDIANDGKVWPSHPQLCTAVPKNVPPLISRVPVSVDVSFDELWTIRCTVAGDYSFAFDNWISVATAHVTDSNPANNIAHLELRDDVAPVDTDGDTLYNDGDDDDDGDGFADLSEVYVSTDPDDACPNDAGHAAWPLDQDNNGTILIVGDVTSYTGKLFTAVTCPGGADCRLDLDSNGTILIVGDVTMYTGKLFESCP